MCQAQTKKKLRVTMESLRPSMNAQFGGQRGCIWSHNIVGRNGTMKDQAERDVFQSLKITDHNEVIAGHNMSLILLQALHCDYVCVRIYFNYVPLL